MFNFLKKKNPTEQTATEIQIKIEGMHCGSCAITIDDTIEEMDGVFASSTSYARSMTTVKCDPKKVAKNQIEKIIKELGYSVEK